MTNRHPPEMKIRLSAALRRQVEKAARTNNRTLNSEVLSRLERTFREDAENAGAGMRWIAKAKKGSLAEVEKRLTALEAAVFALVTDETAKELEERIAALEGLIRKAKS